MRAEKVGDQTLLTKIIESLVQAELSAIFIVDRFKNYVSIFCSSDYFFGYSYFFNVVYSGAGSAMGFMR